MLLEVSVGEAIDKYIILEIKKEKISDINKKNDIIREISVFKLDDIINKFDSYYKFLKYINSEIWDMTDKLQEIDFKDKLYAEYSYELFILNQKRFRLKNIFNKLLESNLKEQKSIKLKKCNLYISDEDIIYKKIPEINHLSIEYDFINIDVKYKDILNKIIGCPTFVYNQKNPDNENNLYLNEINLNTGIRGFFENNPLSYKFAGRLGDFIQGLSVVNEKFYETGKKGIIFIHKNETWRNGLQATYDDTYCVIKSQNYVKDYKIYKGEKIDIDGDIWFHNKLLYKDNWANIYKDTYNIEWGRKPWINVKIEKKWENVVLINEMNYSLIESVNLRKIRKIYSEIIYIGYDKNSYDLFKRRHRLDIPLYTPKSFEDLCIAINSCKLLIGCLSGILTIGHATHKKRIIGLRGRDGDNVHNMNLDKYLKNVLYSFE